MLSRYTAFRSSARCCPTLAPRGRTTFTRPQSVQPQPTQAGSSQCVELIRGSPPFGAGAGAGAGSGTGGVRGGGQPRPRGRIGTGRSGNGGQHVGQLPA